MQRALIQQVVLAIEAKYLSALHNRITRQLPPDIREIYLYLFRIYGKIKPEFLLQRKNEVEKKRYDMADPIDQIFNKIEDLAELGELSDKLRSSPSITSFR